MLFTIMYELFLGLSGLYAIARPSVCLSHGWITQTDGWS